jgi:hypothetical protein
MFGHFYCENCGKTHNDWTLGNSLMMCNVCKEKGGVGYIDDFRCITGITDMICTVPDDSEFRAFFTENVERTNSFDMKNIFKIASKDERMKKWLERHIDDYLKLAYNDFKTQEMIWFEIEERRKSLQV